MAGLDSDSSVDQGHRRDVCKELEEVSEPVRDQARKAAGQANKVQACARKQGSCPPGVQTQS